MARMTGFFNSHLLLLAVNILNLVASGLVISVSVINIANHDSPTNVIIYNAYTACLFLILAVIELRPVAFVADQLKFLQTYRGRGLVYTFFGCLVYSSVIFNVVACVFIVALGVVLFILSWVNLTSPRYDLRYNWTQWRQRKNNNFPEFSSEACSSSNAGDKFMECSVTAMNYHNARRQLGYLFDSHIVPDNAERSQKAFSVEPGSAHKQGARALPTPAPNVGQASERLDNSKSKTLPDIANQQNLNIEQPRPQQLPPHPPPQEVDPPIDNQARNVQFISPCSSNSQALWENLSDISKVLDQDLYEQTSSPHRAQKPLDTRIGQQARAIRFS